MNTEDFQKYSHVFAFAVSQDSDLTKEVDEFETKVFFEGANFFQELSMEEVWSAVTEELEFKSPDKTSLFEGCKTIRQSRL